MRSTKKDRSSSKRVIKMVERLIEPFAYKFTQTYVVLATSRTLNCVEPYTQTIT